jgi:endoglucanase
MKRIALLVMVMMFYFVAKSNPKIPPGVSLAFKRAQSLDDGISISWLEQTWKENFFKTGGLKDSDFQLLKRLGFRSIRLPVAFDYLESRGLPLDDVFTRIDDVLKQCRKYGLKLIIDYHYGKLNDENFLTETPSLIKLWINITKRYLHEPGDLLFFELYNEPPHMNPSIWKDAVYNIDAAIRKIDQQRTLLIGASNFNSIYELSRFVRLADNNIIYTFHFYEPFFFTHQGAEWVGDQVATTGVPFPYSVENFPKLNDKAKGTWGETNYNQYRTDGNVQSVVDKLKIVKAWSERYVVPVICGEYGVYNKYASLDSRCRYIKAVLATLKQMKIPGILWDYNSSFSLFTGPPSMANLPDCMKDAIGYHE